MSKQFLLFSLLFITGLSFAQPPGGPDGPPQDGPKDRKEMIEAQKVAFISRELELTPEEAQVFWPVYNEYEAEIEVVRKERKGYMKELKDIDDLDGDRAYELTGLLFELDKKESDIRSKYLGKFAEVLDKKKAAKVFMAEEKFKRFLLKTLKNDGHKGGRGNDGPPPRHH